MQQVSIAKPGGLSRLIVEETPRPTPGPGQILVRTDSIGVNFADCVVRLGLYPSAKKYAGYPMSPGFECAGEVAELGPGVEGFEVGAAVLGVTRFFAYREYVILEAENTFRRPAALDPLRAGAFTVVALTAYYALFTLGQLGAGQSVLVHSAAGGVGSMMVQLAKNAGAHVVGVVSSEQKRKFVEDLGADVVITRASTPKTSQLRAALEQAAPTGFHVICDANGYETLRLSYQQLRPMGRLIIYGAHTMLKRGGSGIDWPRLIWTFLRTPRFFPLDLTNDNKTISGFNLSYLFDEGQALLASAMQEMLAQVEAGKLRVPEIQALPLSQVAEAHRLLQSGSTRGKLTLVPDAVYPALCQAEGDLNARPASFP